MKFEIEGKEAVVEKPVVLGLEYSNNGSPNGGIFVTANHYKLFFIDANGTFTRIGALPGSLGFKLDILGRLDIEG